MACVRLFASPFPKLSWHVAIPQESEKGVLGTGVTKTKVFLKVVRREGLRQSRLPWKKVLTCTTPCLEPLVPTLRISYGRREVRARGQAKLPPDGREGADAAAPGRGLRVTGKWRQGIVWAPRQADHTHKTQRHEKRLMAALTTDCR